MKDSITKYIWLKNRLNGLPTDIAWKFGSRSTIKNARGVRILLYHGVCKIDPFRFNTIFIDLKKFEAQLKLFRQYFNVISLNEIYDHKYDEKKFNVCLSFDDGFANNYKYVLPLLEKYEMPASFFITGIREAGYDILWNDVLSIANKYGPAKISLNGKDFIKGKDGRYVSTTSSQLLAEILRGSDFDGKKEMIQPFMSLKDKADNDYWLQMTEAQIRELSSSKWVTIGCHGYYHNDLAKIPISVASIEMMRSKQFLEKIIGKEIDAIAFPYGSYSQALVTEAKNIGFTKILATDFLFPVDANETTMKERLTINPFISNINQLHAIIAGKY